MHLLHFIIKMKCHLIFTVIFMYSRSMFMHDFLEPDHLTVALLFIFNNCQLYCTSRSKNQTKCKIFCASKFWNKGNFSGDCKYQKRLPMFVWDRIHWFEACSNQILVLIFSKYFVNQFTKNIYIKIFCCCKCTEYSGMSTYVEKNAS